MTSRREQPIYESSRARCEKDIVNEIQFVILDRVNRKVLLVANGPNKWMLPGFLSNEVGATSIPDVCIGAKSVIGIQFPFIVLRQSYVEELFIERSDISAVVNRTILFVECRAECQHVPPGCFWVPISSSACDANVVHVSHSEQEAERAIRRELEQTIANISPPRRVPWASGEWYHDTLRRMQKVLLGKNLHVIGQFVQIRSSFRGVVLKIKTSGGDYYFKCSPSTSNDAGVTMIMSSVVPDLVAKPLFADVRRREMILADHGDETGWCGLQREDRLHLVRDLARLHRASITELPKLLKVGLPCYSPLWMRENLDTLLYSKELSSIRETGVWRTLLGMKPKLYNALTEVASWKMPDCLIHNDLWDGNLTRKSPEERSGFRFFDFDSSFASHPIFDVDWCRRDQLEVYAKEMDIADIDGLCRLKKKAYSLAPLVEAFRYLDISREAEDGCPREDAISWLKQSVRSLSL